MNTQTKWTLIAIGLLTLAATSYSLLQGNRDTVIFMGLIIGLALILFSLSKKTH